MKKKEYLEKLKEIIAAIKKPQELAKEIGLDNLSQPGIIKEIITASYLKHRVHPKKKEHDAEDFNNAETKFEYLSCLEGQSFQFDRVDDINLKEKVVNRNKWVYCAIFDKKEKLKILRVYEVEPKALYKVLAEKHRKSKKGANHVGITENEIKKSLVEKGKAKLVKKNSFRIKL